ncbi:MAG: hypothetical protein LH702_28945 [Phormidesmis sp. CAN_BIN44]|nr:hypothetical protein [Phormidesmis sp. CAN_BIN44]
MTASQPSKPLSTKRSNPCPVCSDVKGKCRTFTDRPIVLCANLTSSLDTAPGYEYKKPASNEFWAVWAPTDNESTFDREAWQRRKQQTEQKIKRVGDMLSVEERDRQFKAIARASGYPTFTHRQNLEKRLLTPQQIEQLSKQGLLWSWQAGEQVEGVTARLPGVDSQGRLRNFNALAIGIPDVDGNILGVKLRTDDPKANTRYFWGSSESIGGSGINLPNGEVPIGFYRPLGDVTHGAICLGEGELKPMIAAQLHGALFIGASGGNFASSPKQLKSYIETGFKELGAIPPIELCADAGAIVNPNVLRQYRSTFDLLQSWGYQVSIRWWNQVTKQDSDVDEIDPETFKSAQLLTVAEFEAIAETFLPVTTLSQPQNLTYEEEVERVQKKLRSLTYTPTTELNQRFLGELPLPTPGTITAISAACKVGKTESMNGFVDDQGVKRFEGIIAKHRAAHPDAKIFVIGYRNTLLKQTAKRLGITHIQDLRGKGYRATQATREIAFCLDSLDKIDLDNIPPNSLIILDEGDATLKHGLEGGTLKGRQAEILSLFQKTLNKVLGDDGAVLLMEDNLTDLPIDTLKALTGNQYPVDLTINRFKPSKWDVSIGGGSKAGVTKRIVDCLRSGERLMVVTSAQKYGEELDLIIQQEFDGTKKIVRLDSKTVELLHSLVDDPNAWLKDAGIDLLIVSPTAESGFNITIDVFDRVIGYFASSETRSQIQLLERYRLDVPREIFCLKFCNFGDGNGRSPLPSNILKDWKLLARQTAMVNQIEPSLQADADSNPDLSKRLERFQNPSEQQEIWNQAAANYRARINGSNAAMLARLTDALTDRGHDVASTKWQKDDRSKELHKQARREIDRGGATKLSSADAHGMALDDARATLNSGTASQDDRLIAYKRVLQDELPGAPLDDVDFVLKSIIENSGRFKRQTEFLFLCQNSDIASFLDKRAFESQLDKPFMLLRRFRHNRVKVDLMAGGFDMLMQIVHSSNYRESDETLQNFKQWAVKNAFEIGRVYEMKVTEEQTAITIANKFLKNLGYETESVKHEGSGRNGEKRSRIWQVIDADCPHRQEILKALRLKWEREFSKGAYTVLNTEEPLNKTVYATSEMQPDLERWLSPDSLKEIHQQWASAETEEEREIWRQVIPIAVLELAIAPNRA